MNPFPKNRKEVIEPFKCMFKSIYPDLKCFKWYELIIIVIFGLTMICFSILDFNVLVNKTESGTSGNQTSVIKWINDEALGYALWQRVLMTLNGLASFTGVLSVVLVSKRKISTFFWGIINNLLLGLFSFAYGYAGNAQIFIFYVVPMQVVCLYVWYIAMNLNQDPDDSQTFPFRGKLTVKRMDLTEWIIYFMLLCMVGAGFYYEIPVFSKALTGSYPFDDQIVPHILDATSDALIVIAYILMLQQYIEQWILWFALDVISIAMYSGIGNPLDFNILVMNAIFTLNAIYGFTLWMMSYFKAKRAGVDLPGLPSDSPSNPPNSNPIVLV